MVILNTAAFADTIVPWRIRLCRVPGLGEWLVRGLNGFAWPATWMAVSKPMPAEVKRGYLHPYDNWANRIATHRFVVDIPTGEDRASDRVLAEVETRLSVLRERPVRILWGGRDFCFNRHYFERWMQLLPGAVADYLPEAGHYLLEDAPEYCLAGIVRHLTA